eukprot:jgi/Tetstr1/423158/TSEL_013926.t1
MFPHTSSAKDKAVLSAVFDECWPRDNQTWIPYPLKKTHRFPIAKPPSSPYVRRQLADRIECSAQQIVSLPLAGTAASPKLHGLVGVLAQQQKRSGGIIKHNTNAVENLAAIAVPGDNVEGSSPEPPAKKAKQPAKPADGGLAQGRGGAGARAGGGALGSRAGRRAAVAAAATREQQAGRRGGPSQNRM